MKHSRKAALAAGLGCVALLCCTQSRAEREDRKLMEKEWRKGGLEELQAMTAKDVKSMQVFNLTRQNKKEYREHAVTTARNAPQIEAFLRFLKTSKQYFIPHGVPLCPFPPDRVLVIEPATGAPFEFAYSDYLDEPFAGVHSLELKEALYALGGGNFPISVILLKEGQVNAVSHHAVIAPHRGGFGGGNLAAELRLTPQVGISLWVKIGDDERPVVERDMPMHFGDAKVFASGNEGIYIVLLHKPL